jgi:hypothetical protein
MVAIEMVSTVKAATFIRATKIQLFFTTHTRNPKRALNRADCPHGHAFTRARSPETHEARAHHLHAAWLEARNPRLGVVACLEMALAKPGEVAASEPGEPNASGPTP